MDKPANKAEPYSFVLNDEIFIFLIFFVLTITDRICYIAANNFRMKASFKFSDDFNDDLLHWNLIPNSIL
jgi:hypothetical protein